MLIRGTLNPNVLSLLGRIRHTNTLVIADTVQYGNIIGESA